MPATVVLFKDYPALPTKPARLYCDSNFLIKLLFYSDNAVNPAILADKEKDCYHFYTQIKQENVELITSVYGFTELIHFYFFWNGDDAIYNVVKRFFSQNSIKISRTAIHDRYKYFIKNHPTDFRIAFNKISHRIAKAEVFLNQIGVKILYPLPSPQLTNISKNIIEYAAILLDAFPKLESNDAMHLAIADYLNIPYLISLDDAFKDVDGFTIFTLN